jgi:hypothetical protein
MGRSFALEMGSKIPGGDQRLGESMETLKFNRSEADISQILSTTMEIHWSMYPPTSSHNTPPAKSTDIPRSLQPPIAKDGL